MAKLPGVSVVLCTYNGVTHLREQLASLKDQTAAPAELIVCDDSSTDESAMVAIAFAKEASFPVRVTVNPTNLGFIANFEKAIVLATQPIISLCDQDDVWRKDKIERTRSLFAASDVGLVFTDGDAVDDRLRPIGKRLFDYCKFDRGRQRRVRNGDAFDVMLDGNVVTGATMAFRSTLRNAVVPIPKNTGRFHDAWIALIASALTDVDFIGEPLLKYRQHHDQVTGIRPNERPVVLDRDHYADHVAFLDQVDARLAAQPETPRLVESRRRLAERRTHVEARANMPPSPRERLPFVMRELSSGRYGRYSNGMRSVLRDLLGGS